MKTIIKVNKNSFRNISTLFSKYIKDKLDLESEIAYYAHADFHRCSSGIRTKNFSVKIYCLKIFLSHLMKSKFRLARITKERHKILFWMDNYQIEEYDDAPIKKAAIQKGYQVLEPSISFLSLYHSFKNLLFILLNINKSIEKVANDYFEINEEKKLKKDEIVDCLNSKYLINQLIKARCYNYPFLIINRKIMVEVDKAFIIYRSNGEITPFIFDRFLNRKELSLKRKGNIKQVLYAHASLPVSVPLTMISSYVDLVLTKNEIAKRILNDRADNFNTEVKVIGDPRIEVFRSKGFKKKELITLALTEYKNSFLSENHNHTDLIFIKQFIKAIDSRFSVEVKRRYKKSSCVKENSLIEEFRTNRDLLESVMESKVAFVLGNSKMKMVSSVFMDYYQMGVPTAIVIADEEFELLKIDWKIGFDLSEVTLLRTSEVLDIVSSEEKIKDFINDNKKMKLKALIL